MKVVLINVEIEAVQAWCKLIMCEPERLAFDATAEFAAYTCGAEDQIDSTHAVKGRTANRAVADELMKLNLQAGLFFALTECGLCGEFAPAHETTGKGSLALWALDDKETACLLYHKADAGKGREVAAQADIEQIKEDANKALEGQV